MWGKWRTVAPRGVESPTGNPIEVPGLFRHRWFYHKHKDAEETLQGQRTLKKKRRKAPNERLHTKKNI